MSLRFVVAALAAAVCAHGQTVAVASYGTSAGGWSNFNTFPRVVADVNGDGKADIVGFASDGVYVSLSQGSTFTPPARWHDGFSTNKDWVNAAQFPRTAADVNGDGKADVIGFARDGVYVALSQGSSFGTITLGFAGFAVNAGGWTDFNTFPRMAADVNGDGRADIVGVANDGVYVALSQGSSFSAPMRWSTGFSPAATWATFEAYPRYAADINADGKADLVGFGSDGVYVALSNGAGFGAPAKWTSEFGTASGWTGFNSMPRFVGDWNGDKRADIIGFTPSGMFVALNNGAAFDKGAVMSQALNNGFTSQDAAPRAVADVTGDGRADAIGFGAAGVIIVPSGTATVPAPPGVPTVTSTLLWPPILPAITPYPTAPPPGTPVCIATRGKSCGETKADRVGAYKLNTTCAAGFYDMIHGGTCWKCPDDDGRGPWIRSTDAIDKDTACWRVPKESHSYAKREAKTPWAWECPGDSFWDGHEGGTCWTCPVSHPRRSGRPIFAHDACLSSLNETQPATLLTYSGCPKPNAGEMGLQGKRQPGEPFLDIGAAASCFACPVSDEEGHFLISRRNTKHVVNENGCDVLFKWKPAAFKEPGLSGLQGVKELIWEQKLLDPNILLADLLIQAQAAGFAPGTPQATAWIEKAWSEIAAAPYASIPLRTALFLRLRQAIVLDPAQRTAAQARLVSSFEDYMNRKRVYLPEQALSMHDAWVAADERARAMYSTTLTQMFDLGRRPPNYKAMTTSLAAATTPAAVLMASFGQANLAAKTLQGYITTMSGSKVFQPTNSLYQAFRAGQLVTNLTKIGPASMAAGGAAAILSGFGILMSLAIEQVTEIAVARPRLEAALAAAKVRVDARQLLAEADDDKIAYYWASALDTPEIEDTQMKEVAGKAAVIAKTMGYQLK
jgi:hypothetical protein